MKKLLIIIFTTIIVVGLVGCGGKKEEAKQTSKEQPKQEEKKTDGNSDSKQIFEVYKIKDKSKNEVNKILGESIESKPASFTYKDTNLKAENCFINTYNKDNLKMEIFFVENKVARITITPSEKLIYPTQDKKLFKLVGLEYEVAPVCSNNITKWNNVKDIYEISLFPKQGDTNIDYMYIVLDEKYK